jgi:hypothetical protein
MRDKVNVLPKGDDIVVVCSGIVDEDLKEGTVLLELVFEI